ncbi:hypothetical protein CONPUDRAFT_165805 [Coniophora puteana RWD-64-598 SS2]|uniref:Uncharacterized protein n=1 Tax=Coniophora puteana (strain RWD-64-598) TaxID=741705 RepID=A0A5M3MMF2_CONPW|nr:uncharacterized protein CONPUDRAFT_165805 [Coniophora puteana RWD-64-598 SS2]EIW80216.1 hypothetical protein CONPUDRAFT_165805 [Coniophora puteana RWD-64-598 SS2]
MGISAISAQHSGSETSGDELSQDFYSLSLSSCTPKIKRRELARNRPYPRPNTRLAPTNVYHLISLQTEEKLLDSLEWAWGMGWRRLNVGSQFNTLPVRFTFEEDVNEDELLLFPEPRILEMLIDQSDQPKFRDTIAPKLNKLFRCQPSTFKFYLVPRSGLQDNVLIDSSAPGQPKSVHTYPYSTLGPILSHVRPQYAVWGTSMKMKDTHYPECDFVDRALRQTLALHAPELCARSSWRPEGKIRLQVFEAYSNWKKQRPPAHFRQHIRSTRRFHPTYGVPPAISDEDLCHSEGENGSLPASVKDDCAARVKRWILESEFWLGGLEWAWGMGWRRLNVGSQLNTLFVGFTFDEAVDESQLLFFPEQSVLEMLKDQSDQPMVRDEVAPKLNKIFRHRSSMFKYHLVPRTSLRDKVLVDVSAPGQPPAVHTYPFTTLGPVLSHCRPQYAVWGTITKLGDICGPEYDAINRAHRQILALHVPELNNLGFWRPERAIHASAFDVYRKWNRQQPPEQFHRHMRATKRFHPTYGLPAAVDDDEPCYSEEERDSSRSVSATDYADCEARVTKFGTRLSILHRQILARLAFVLETSARPLPRYLAVFE